MLKSSLFQSLFTEAASKEPYKYSEEELAQQRKEVEASKKESKLRKKTLKNPEEAPEPVQAKADKKAPYAPGHKTHKAALSKLEKGETDEPSKPVSRGKLKGKEKTEDFDADKVLLSREEGQKYFHKFPVDIDNILNSIERQEFKLNHVNANQLAFNIGSFIAKNSTKLPKMAETNAAAAELLSLTGSYEAFKNLTLSNPSDAAYVAYTVLVFPFLDQLVLTDMCRNSGAVVELNGLSESYSGTLLEKIDFAGRLPIFSDFEHVTNDEVRALLIKIRAVVLASSNGATIKKAAKAIDKDIQKASKGSVLDNKQLTNIALTLYYSLLSKAMPYDLDMFELDPNKIRNFLNAKGSGVDQLRAVEGLLTDTANAVALAKKHIIGEDPALHSGTTVRNARQQANFSYAQKAGLLSKERSQSKLTAELTNANVFEFAIKRVPKVNDMYNELLGILDSAAQLETEEDFTALHNDIQSKGDQLLGEIAATPELTGVTASLTDAEGKELTSAKALAEYLVGTIKQLQSISVETLASIYGLAKLPVVRLYSDKIISEVTKALDAYKATRAKVNTSATNALEALGFDFLSNILQAENKAAYFDTQLTRLAPSEMKARKSAPTSKEGDEFEFEPTKKAETSVKISQRVRQEMANKKVELNSLELTLAHLPHISEELFLDLRTAIGQAPDDVKKAFVFASDEETKKSVEEYISGVLTPVTEKYFTAASPKDTSLFNLSNKIDSTSLELYTTDEMSKMASDGNLIGDLAITVLPQLTTLSDEVIKFIDLAASVVDFSGIYISDNGTVAADFSLAPIKSLNSGFFSKYLLLENADPHIKGNRIVMMMLQRFILSKLSAPMSDALSNLKMEDILSSDAMKLPGFTSRFTSFFNTLKSAPMQIEKTIKYIDETIIKDAGGSTVRYLPAGDRTKEPVEVFIPTAVNTEYKSAVHSVGAKIFGAEIAGRKAAESSSAEKKFISKLFAAGSTQDAVQAFKGALSIVGTAANYQVAVAMSSLPEDAMRKLLQSNFEDPERISEINGVFAEAQEYVFKAYENFIKKINEFSNFVGQPKRIGNQVLASILNQLDAKSSIESSQLTQYAEMLAGLRETGEHADTSLAAIAKKLGMSYVGTGIGKYEKLSTSEITPEQETAQSLSSIPGMLSTTDAGVAAINVSKIERKIVSIQKDLTSRITGSRRTLTTKGSSQFKAYAKATSYSEYCFKALSAIKQLESIFCGPNGLLTEFNQAEDEAKLAEQLKIISKDLRVMEEFFKKITNITALNSLSAQTELLSFLKGELVPVTRGKLDYLSTLLASPDKDTLDKMAADMKIIYDSTRGSKELASLLSSGLSLAQIQQGVANILESHGESLQAASAESEETMKPYEVVLDQAAAFIKNPDKHAFRPDVLATLLDKNTYAPGVVPDLDRQELAVLAKQMFAKLDQDTRAQFLAGIPNSEDTPGRWAQFTNLITGNKVNFANTALVEATASDTLNALLLEGSIQGEHPELVALAKVLKAMGATGKGGQIIDHTGNPFMFSNTEYARLLTRLPFVFPGSRMFKARTALTSVLGLPDSNIFYLASHDENLINGDTVKVAVFGFNKTIELLDNNFKPASSELNEETPNGKQEESK